MLALLKYWKPLAAAALLVGAFLTGKHWESVHREAEQAELQRQAAMLLKEEMEFSYKLGVKLAETEKQRDAYFKKLGKTKTTIVERVVYSGQCIDDDGRMLINDYLRGEIPTTSRSNGTMPAANPAGGEHGEGSDSEAN